MEQRTTQHGEKRCTQLMAYFVISCRYFVRNVLSRSEVAMKSIHAFRIFAIVVVVAWCGRNAQAAEETPRTVAAALHISLTILATNVGNIHVHSISGLATTQGDGRTGLECVYRIR